MSIQKRKVVVTGPGHVGSHCGFSLIAQAMDLADAVNDLPLRAGRPAVVNPKRPRYNRKQGDFRLEEGSEWRK
ncbi:MAG: hypothetical protein LKJ21_03355 [Oscillospiraceae bacterium]|jgi:hypothetical protein|nr:hypothetical protein [Oscillospiraceae bacterium]MCI1990324.1 hypothetical protein [Oscillospiraceae bacterium]MCI2034603.1 hypothetical protein [Oscillospiraceae bacterium]